LISVAGGGDTVAALNAAGVSDDFSYVSTAAVAFLEWLEGKDLPGVKALAGLRRSGGLCPAHAQAARPIRSGRLNQVFRDLHRVQRCAFQELIAGGKTTPR